MSNCPIVRPILMWHCLVIASIGVVTIFDNIVTVIITYSNKPGTGVGWKIISRWSWRRLIWRQRPESHGSWRRMLRHHVLHPDRSAPLGWSRTIKDHDVKPSSHDNCTTLHRIKRVNHNWSDLSYHCLVTAEHQGNGARPGSATVHRLPPTGSPAMPAIPHPPVSSHN